MCHRTKVFKAKACDGTVRAVKTTLHSTDEDRELALNEANLHVGLRHPNIIYVYAVWSLSAMEHSF